MTDIKRKTKLIGKTGIAIDLENTDIIQGVLNGVQGRATADILDLDDIFQFAKDAESYLEKIGIAQAYRSGTTFTYNPSGPNSRAYGYARLGTKIVMQRRTSGWYLTSTERISTFPKEREKRIISFTSSQKFILLKKLVRDFNVSTDELSSFVTIIKY